MNHFHWYVGLRFLRSKRRDGFLSFVTIISMVGMVLGVASLIIVLSVMNGFQKELKDKVLAFVPHAGLQKYEPMQDWQKYAEVAKEHPHVLGASGFTEIQGLLISAQSNKGVVIQGVQPSDLYDNTGFDESNLNSDLLTELESSRWGIIMGVSMASNLGLMPGDKVKFLVPEQTSINFSGLDLMTRSLTLIGTFQVRSEVDENVALIHLRDAASLLRYPKGAATSIRIKTDDLFKAREYATEISELFDENIHIFDWTKTHGNLFAAIQMERNIIALLLLIVIFVGSLNILTNLMMVVNEKNGDIAIFRTMGAKPLQIMKIFMVQGTFIGMIGTLLGVLLGLSISYSLPLIATFLENNFGIYFLDPSVYFTSSFPSDPHLWDVTLVCIFSFVLSFLITIIPSLKAAYVPPAEALRYEV